LIQEGAWHLSECDMMNGIFSSLKSIVDGTPQYARAGDCHELVHTVGHVYRFELKCFLHVAGDWRLQTREWSS